MEEALEQIGPRLGLDVRRFNQAGILAATAAREGPDLIVIAGPRSLAPLDRLHNDPRSRGVPVLLITSELREEDARFKALAITSQVLDFPPEESVLELRIKQLLAERGSPSGLRDYATARLELEATALWGGRICWVEGNRLLLETDVELPEGTEGPLAGPVLAHHGLSATWARVVAMDTEDLHYDYTVNLELELVQSPDGLTEGLRSDPHCQAHRKTRLCLLAEDPSRLGPVAACLDLTRYSLRWIRHLDALPKHASRMRPAAVLLDPEHPELQDRAKFGLLKRLPEPTPPLVPIVAPEERSSWERLGDLCATLEPPSLEDPNAFADLVDRVCGSQEPAEAEAEAGERIYLKREHPFSHARLSIPAKLVELSEVAAGVRFAQRVHAGGRLRLDVPELIHSGLQPLYGRVLETARPDERVQVLWMGVGGEAEARKLRSYVQGVIMEARRREYGGQEPGDRE